MGFNNVRTRSCLLNPTPLKLEEYYIQSLVMIEVQVVYNKLIEEQTIEFKEKYTQESLLILLYFHIQILVHEGLHRLKCNNNSFYHSGTTT